jgi:ankyrin repeat protein
MVEMLVANGAAINEKGYEGNTPLHEAIIYAGSIETVKVLLQNGADVNAKNEKGKTPLQLAEEKGITKLAELLRQHGAKE